jgi:hypothetical protein
MASAACRFSSVFASSTTEFAGAFNWASALSSRAWRSAIHRSYFACV